MVILTLPSLQDSSTIRSRKESRRTSWCAIWCFSSSGKAQGIRFDASPDMRKHHRDDVEHERRQRKGQVLSVRIQDRRHAMHWTVCSDLTWTEDTIARRALTKYWIISNRSRIQHFFKKKRVVNSLIKGRYHSFALLKLPKIGFYPVPHYRS